MRFSALLFLAALLSLRGLAAESDENLRFERAIGGQWRLGETSVDEKIATALSAIAEPFATTLEFARIPGGGWQTCRKATLKEVGSCLPADPTLSKILDGLVTKNEAPSSENFFQGIFNRFFKKRNPEASETADTDGSAAESEGSPAQTPRSATSSDAKPEGQATDKVAQEPPKPVIGRSTSNLRYVHDETLGRLASVGTEKTPVPTDAVAYTWNPDGSIKWIKAEELGEFAAAGAASVQGSEDHAVGEAGSAQTQTGRAPADKPTYAIQSAQGRVTALTVGGKRTEVPPTATSYYFDDQGQPQFVLGNGLPTDTMNIAQKPSRANQPADMAGVGLPTPSNNRAPAQSNPSNPSSSLPTLIFGTGFYCGACETAKTILGNQGINPQTGVDQNGAQRFRVSYASYSEAVSLGGVPCQRGQVSAVGVRNCNY